VLIETKKTKKKKKKKKNRHFDSKEDYDEKGMEDETWLSKRRRKKVSPTIIVRVVVHY
jgi:hypothetical protein